MLIPNSTISDAKSVRFVKKEVVKISNISVAPKNRGRKRNYLSKISNRIITFFRGSVPPQHSEIEDHLSNTLGIINLLSEDRLSVYQHENIAALKSSCSFLAEQFGLNQYSHQLPEIKNNLKTRFSTIDTSNHKGKIMLICLAPLQKKILKNLMTKWGYQVDILSKLPAELDLITVLDYNLIVISKTAHQTTTSQLKSLKALGQPFLLLLNSQIITDSFVRKFPHITGPIDPDFLKYKLEKILREKKSKELL